MAKVIVTFVNPYDFKDEQTGRQVVGMTCWYINPTAKAARSGLGLTPVKCILDPVFEREMRVIPGVYDFEFELAAGAGGRATVDVVGVELVGPVDFKEVIKQVASKVAAPGAPVPVR